jgi:hypothetical protein
VDEHAGKSSPLVSFGGIGSATSLAKFTLLANGGELLVVVFSASPSRNDNWLVAGIDRVSKFRRRFRPASEGCRTHHGASLVPRHWLSAIPEPRSHAFADPRIIRLRLRHNQMSRKFSLTRSLCA